MDNILKIDELLNNGYVCLQKESCVPANPIVRSGLKLTFSKDGDFVNVDINIDKDDVGKVSEVFSKHKHPITILL